MKNNLKKLQDENFNAKYKEVMSKFKGRYDDFFHKQLCKNFYLEGVIFQQLVEINTLKELSGVTNG